jgi:hypothetical protein
MTGPQGKEMFEAELKTIFMNANAESKKVHSIFTPVWLDLPGSTTAQIQNFDDLINAINETPIKHKLVGLMYQLKGREF